MGVDAPKSAAAIAITSAPAEDRARAAVGEVRRAREHGIAQCLTCSTELLPDTAPRRATASSCSAASVRRELAREFGTPLVVYDEATLRGQARAYLDAAPGALVAYGTKAFPSVAVLRLLAEEGLGADVSTVGELEFALRAGIPGERLVIHGNNKEDELLRARGRAWAR